MGKNTAIVLVVALVAAVAVAFLWTYRGSGSLALNLPFGADVTLEGENPQPPQPGAIVGEDLEAKGDLTAAGRTGGDVEIKRAKAEGDMTLTTETPEGGADPKH